MLGTPCDQGPLSGPDNAVSVGLHLYVTDVDKSFQRALEAGAKAVSEVKDQFYGDRSGTLKDPYGHLWFLATRKEDLTEEQIRQRAMEMFSRVEIFRVWAGLFAGKPAPTGIFGVYTIGVTQKNTVGAGLPAKGPALATHITLHEPPHHASTLARMPNTFRMHPTRT
jgi:hypothetical protein